MKIHFTGRHFDITKAIKDFTEEKLNKIERFNEGILEAHVILSIEKYRHIAEVTLHGKHISFSGKEETQDMYSSIGLVLDKIEKQAKKHKGKLVGRKRAKQATAKVAAMPNRGEETGAKEPSPPSVVKTNSYAVKPMTLEEAVFQMEHSKSEFLVFKNSQSEKVNVLYRRKNGDFGLIDPEL
jgi:putative sigma-54 modulation protein